MKTLPALATLALAALVACDGLPAPTSSPSPAIGVPPSSSTANPQGAPPPSPASFPSPSTPSPTLTSPGTPSSVGSPNSNPVPAPPSSSPSKRPSTVSTASASALPSPIETESPAPSKTPAFHFGGFVADAPAGAVVQTVPELGLALGRAADFELLYSGIKTSFAGDPASGLVPMVALKWGASSDVANGVDDAAFTSYAKSMAAYGKTIYFRPEWEFNLAPGGVFKGGDPATFIAAWIHLHDLMAPIAPNVVWYWCGSGGLYKTMAQFYPVLRPDTVDWVGFDHYDHKGVPFYQLIAPAYAAVDVFGKPVFVGETQTVNPAVFWGGATKALLVANEPHLIGIGIFDAKGAGKPSWVITDPAYFAASSAALATFGP